MRQGDATRNKAAIGGTLPAESSLPDSATAPGAEGEAGFQFPSRDRDRAGKRRTTAELRRVQGSWMSPR